MVKPGRSFSIKSALSCHFFPTPPTSYTTLRREKSTPIVIFQRKGWINSRMVYVYYRCRLIGLIRPAVIPFQGPPRPVLIIGGGKATLVGFSVGGQEICQNYTVFFNIHPNDNLSCSFYRKETVEPNGTVGPKVRVFGHCQSRRNRRCEFLRTTWRILNHLSTNQRPFSLSPRLSGPGDCHDST